jgi:hypothetical protein
VEAYDDLAALICSPSEGVADTALTAAAKGTHS